MVLASVDPVNFFDYVQKAFDVLVSFVSGIYSALLELYAVVVKSMSFSLQLSGLMPPILGSCILLVIAIYIIKLIAGR